MKNLINKPTNLILLFSLLLLQGIQAQDDSTDEAIIEELSDNLDLEAVASIFAESEDLEAFENALNDPDTQVSNLDLNEDDQVDYLRVMESAEDDTHVIALQAVLDEDVYQDVATIEVEQDDSGETVVQFVGDVYLYGPNYIIEPVYVFRPAIFSIFWRPYYRPYRSVYFWGYYPPRWRYWRPFPVAHYTRNVYVHVNARHTYRRTHIRYSTRAVTVHRSVRRNDYARTNPNRSYTARRVAVNTSGGAKYRKTAVNQADGDKYRAAGVNKANGTKKRVAGVNKADGTKKRAVGVNQADGDKYRAVGVNKADGTKKRVAGVNKADGTKKRVASVERPDGSKKTVAVKKNPNGSKRAVTVNKHSDGSRTVKTARKPANARNKSNKSRKSNSRKGKRPNRS